MVLVESAKKPLKISGVLKKPPFQGIDIATAMAYKV